MLLCATPSVLADMSASGVRPDGEGSFGPQSGRGRHSEDGEGSGDVFGEEELYYGTTLVDLVLTEGSRLGVWTGLLPENKRKHTTTDSAQCVIS